MKTTSNYFLLFATLVILLANACSNESFEFTHQNSNKMSRIKFNSTSEFLETYTKLAKMDRVEINKWIHLQNICSATTNPKSLEDSLFSILPFAYQAIFNQEYEFQIQDSIIWLHGKYLYFLGTTNKLHTKDTDSLKIYASSEITPIKQIKTTRNLSNTNFTTIGLNERNRYFLHEFNIPNRNTIRYVHELLTHCINTSDKTVQALLYLSCRLEWHKSKNKWEMASELRNIAIDIHGNANIVASIPSGIGDIYFKRNFSRVQYNQEYLIQSFRGSIQPVSYWQVSLEGVISHELSDYPNTKWNFPSDLPGKIW